MHMKPIALLRIIAPLVGPWCSKKARALVQATKNVLHVEAFQSSIEFEPREQYIQHIPRYRRPRPGRSPRALQGKRGGGGEGTNDLRQAGYNVSYIFFKNFPCSFFAIWTN